MGQDRHFAGEHYVMNEDLFPTIVRNMNTKFNKLQHYEWEAQQNPVKSIIVDVINSPAKQTRHRHTSPSVCGCQLQRLSLLSAHKLYMLVDHPKTRNKMGYIHA